MLQKELAKRLKARYDTKMDGSGWLEVSSDGIPLCRECIRQQLRYIAVALVDVRVGQSAACGQSPRRETLDALRRYKMKRRALKLVLQLLF